VTAMPPPPGAPPSRAAEMVAYDFAVLRVVPHVHLGAFVPVGVVVHARTSGFLGMRVLSDTGELGACVADVDAELLARYLRAYEAICRGAPEAGPVALAPTSERFHWLTAPRSDVLQSSPVHEGLSRNPKAELDVLFAAYVRRKSW
jgi:Protein of unknown function (DUF3037)